MNTWSQAYFIHKGNVHFVGKRCILSQLVEDDMNGYEFDGLITNGNDKARIIWFSFEAMVIYQD